MDFDTVQDGSSASVRGELLVLQKPISFWGGVDLTSGTVVDSRHPQASASLGGKVLCMPTSKGSTAAAGGLLELIFAGHGPVAILFTGDDIAAVTAAHVSEALCSTTPLVGRISSQDFDQLAASPWRGEVEIRRGRIYRLSSSADAPLAPFSLM